MLFCVSRGIEPDVLQLILTCAVSPTINNVILIKIVMTVSIRSSKWAFYFILFMNSVYNNTYILYNLLYGV
jgi:hypothetical protein